MEDPTVLGQVQWLGLAVGHEHVEGGQSEVPLVQQPRDQRPDGLARGGADHGRCEVGEDDTCQCTSAPITWRSGVTCQYGSISGFRIQMVTRLLTPVFPETHRFSSLCLQRICSSLSEVFLPEITSIKQQSRILV